MQLLPQNNSRLEADYDPTPLIVRQMACVRQSRGSRANALTTARDAGRGLVLQSTLVRAMSGGTLPSGPHSLR